MATKTPKKVTISPVDDQKSDWKNSKPIIAITAGATAIAATSTAFFTFFIPAREASLATQIKTLEVGRAEVDKKLMATESELRNVKDLNRKLEIEKRAMQSELASARQTQLFSLGDPYPSGLRAVHVGADISDVRRAFSNAKLDGSTDGVFVLNKQHEVFSKVSYFFDPEGQEKKVTHIVFEIGSVKEFDDKFLLGKLREALGVPQTGSKPSQCAWLTSRAFGVFMVEPYSFMITAEGVRPRVWKPGPRKDDSCV